MRRIWQKLDLELELENTASIEYNATMQIWDSGSIRCERIFTNAHAQTGREVTWKVIERRETETGFEEILEVLPSYITPTKLVWTEVIRINESSNAGFTTPGWSVSCTPI